MKLYEVEQHFHIIFPKKWHTIYETGAMEWMELSPDIFCTNRKKYISDSNAFLMMCCDAEPIFFEELQVWIDTLHEWIAWKQEDTQVMLKQNIRLFPFAQESSGDLYCFLYEKESQKEPKIVLYAHDDYDTPNIVAHSFEEFLYFIMLSAACFEEEIGSAVWNTHVALLDDAYKNKIYGKNAAALEEAYETWIFTEADIWIPQ